MGTGRPNFIPRDVFRAWIKPKRMNSYFTVDRILPTSYISRCEREGNPIKARTRDGGKVFRILDVVARAQSRGLGIVEQCKQKKLLRLTRSELIYHSAKLEAEIATLRSVAKHDLLLDSVAETVTGAGLLTHRQIAKAARRSQPARAVGIYFLICGDRVVYVGQSVNVYARVSQHSSFETWAYTPCREEVLDVMESLYIHWLRPARNGRVNNGGGALYAPMSITELAERLSRPAK